MFNESSTRSTPSKSPTADRSSLPIRDFMSSSPHSIGKSQTLAIAHDMMRQHHIRHLPVLEGGKLVGIVSQRDLYLIETFGDVDPKTVVVEEAMTTEVFAVSPRADLAGVVSKMAEQKIGSCVVLQADKVVGVFTVTDGLRVLASILRDPS